MWWITVHPRPSGPSDRRTVAASPPGSHPQPPSARGSAHPQPPSARGSAHSRPRGHVFPNSGPQVLDGTSRNSHLLAHLDEQPALTDRPGGISSVGRALEWHSRGQEFDSPILHHPHSEARRNPCTSRRLQRASVHFWGPEDSTKKGRTHTRPAFLLNGGLAAISGRLEPSHNQSKRRDPKLGHFHGPSSGRRPPRATDHFAFDRSLACEDSLSETMGMRVAQMLPSPPSPERQADASPPPLRKPGRFQLENPEENS
jgi:hypothetical protein